MACTEEAKPTQQVGAHTCCQLPQNILFWFWASLTWHFHSTLFRFCPECPLLWSAGSTRVLDELLLDEGYIWCLSNVAASSVMHMRPVRIKIWSNGILPFLLVIASAYIPPWSTHLTVAPWASMLDRMTWISIAVRLSLAPPDVSVCKWSYKLFCVSNWQKPSVASTERLTNVLPPWDHGFEILLPNRQCLNWDCSALQKVHESTRRQPMRLTWPELLQPMYSHIFVSDSETCDSTGQKEMERCSTAPLTSHKPRKRLDCDLQQHSPHDASWIVAHRTLWRGMWGSLIPRYGSAFNLSTAVFASHKSCTMLRLIDPMPSDAKADTSGRVSRWTHLTEPHTARNCLFSPSLVSDFLSERRPFGITIGESRSRTNLAWWIGKPYDLSWITIRPA